MKKRNLASASKGVVDDRYIDCLVATTNKWNKISVINSSILSYLEQLMTMTSQELLTASNNNNIYSQ